MISKNFQLSRWSILALLVSSVVWCYSCGPRSNLVSRTSEAMGLSSDLEDFGLDSSFTFEELSSPLSFHLSKSPWTDSYWPIQKKGLARRYMSKDRTSLKDSFSLYTHMSELYDAYESQDDLELIQLSPAEKHDLALSRGSQSQLLSSTKSDFLEKLQVIDATFAEEFKELPDLASGQRTSVGRQVVKKAIRNGAFRLRAVGAKRQLPLFFHSWWRWASRASHPNNMIVGDRSAEIDNVILDDPTAKDWTWEGHCHGWSMAALHNDEPLHAVRAIRKDGRSVIFTEGDIRALLTKAWADQPPKHDKLMVGDRCRDHKTATIKDRYGRPLDARIICNGSASNCTEEGLIIEKRLLVGGQLTFRFRVWDDPSGESHYLMAVRSAKGKAGYTYVGHRFANLAEVVKAVRSSDKSSGKPATMQLQNFCRDTNPAALHILLTKWLAKDRSFAIDRTYSNEVWNHPVKGYELRFEDIPGSTVEPHQLTPIADVQDIYWRYRAPGTKYLVNMTVILHWLDENGPRINYKRTIGGEQLDIDELTPADVTYISSLEPTVLETSLSYTLEFDNERRLIGGEWGLVPVPSPPVGRRMLIEEIPDFIFTYKEGSEPINRQGSSHIDYDNLVRRLHECSLDTTLPQTNGPIKNLDGDPLMVAECPI